MVIFDQLRIADDGSKMYINLHVNKAEYFRDIYLDSITIMTSDRVSETNPFAPTKDYIYKIIFEGSGEDTVNVFDKTFDETFRLLTEQSSSKDVKSADLVLNVNDFIRTWETDPKAMRFNRSDMSNTLFFIYVKCKGTPGSCTPCGLDNEITVAVTFDETLLFQRSMGFIKELSDSCNVSKGFVDYILLWNAFKASVETEHWTDAIDFWKQLLDMWVSRSNPKGSFGFRGCGCNK